jgi:octaprenyl-diphosphate synthase
MILNMVESSTLTSSPNLMQTDEDLTLDKVRAPVKGHIDKFHKFYKDALKTDVMLLDQIIRYLLRQKGKELRPTLVFLSANLFGEINERSYVAGTMIELLHTATLIHDDVVDDADKRRGFLSINKVWKNKAGVLLGDFLLSRGLLISLEHEEYELLKVLSKAVKSMSEGELRQLKSAKLLNMTEDRYFSIISEKTASLLASCCECGAISTCDDREMQQLMYDLGMNLGIAFQIRDDLFDYGMADVGKPTRNDIQERKYTLPLIKALENATSSEKRSIKASIRKRKKSSDEIERIVQFVHDRGGMDYARLKMREYANKAIDQLEQVPDSSAKDDFRRLIQFIITRKK